jgi:UDP-N-acetylmuramoyl-L-alanyl-D-glutamate--2,6-diaminopimelate ligase
LTQPLSPSISRQRTVGRPGTVIEAGQGVQGLLPAAKEEPGLADPDKVESDEGAALEDRLPAGSDGSADDLIGERSGRWNGRKTGAAVRLAGGLLVSPSREAPASAPTSVGYSCRSSFSADVSGAMPSDPLSRLLANQEFAWRREPAAAVALTDIQWRADACAPGSILFFQRFDDGRSDEEIYRRYLARSAFSVLVTNRPLDCFDALAGKGICVTRPGEFPRVVERFCDLVHPLDAGSGDFIGVTGTNGKTTTVKYLESMLLAYGRRVLSIGTLGVFLDGESITETGFTSPPQIELRRLLHGLRGRYDLVVMEASSHALDQGRLQGIAFRDAGWTNFSQDHLDYHGDEASYFAAKARILDQIDDGGRLYCASPEVARRLREHRAPRVPIELLGAATLSPEAVAVRPFLALEHNRKNYALAAALADAVLGAGERAYWRHLTPVDGRFECRVVGSRIIVIDFAHTPDALEAILAAVRSAFPAARVLTLFGCGGDRDRGKRPLMGAAAARGSDRVIVTSDNPRTEDPERIIADILEGMPRDGREVVVERPEAIARLFDLLADRPPEEPWVAVIAGKGHERYVDRGGRKTYYSDQDEVDRNLRRLGWD